MFFLKLLACCHCLHMSTTFALCLRKARFVETKKTKQRKGTKECDS
ncbi:MAG: hypothetical protein C0514_01345 [Candidatus Puniceispirillum sp.]|nr:hypothetical protein [Candidatus Puniceispirillum sp.]